MSGHYNQSRRWRIHPKIPIKTQRRSREKETRKYTNHVRMAVELGCNGVLVSLNNLVKVVGLSVTNIG